VGHFGTGKNISIQEGVSMKYERIIITGTSGAGKTTIARKLCEQHEIFHIVQTVTTREQRTDDELYQYQFITAENFEKLLKNGELLVSSKYRDKSYGITNESIQKVIAMGKIPLLIITPESVRQLLSKKHNTFLTIFIDAPDNILDTRLRQRKEEIDEKIKSQRINDRKCAEEYAKDKEICMYIIKNRNDTDVDEVTQLISNLWDYKNTGGMLPQKMIELMIKHGMLLDNASVDNVQGASYDLVLGDQYFQKGEIKTLNERKPFIIMNPGDYVLVSAKEIANFPKDIAGRFDITVSLFCKGVILSNGPQVDPGFYGGLFCLLFNTSNDEVQLKKGEHFATIEFIKLIAPTASYSGKYQGKKELGDYLPKVVEKSAINQIMEDISSLKKIWWIEYVAILLAIILAIVGIFYK
jgi:deoxycytidine triphosphate deaminase